MQNKCDTPGCDPVKCVKTCGLNQLAVGGQGRVVSVAGEPDVRRRLLEMGFCNGATVEVVRRAADGGSD